jgi:hypothetical protein
MFSNHVYKIIILPTLVIRIPNLEIILFCQHNPTGDGNLELRQAIARSNEILGWEGVGNRQLLCFFKA